MSEISPEARLAVVAAFAYAGPAGGNEAAWRAKLNEGVLRATAAMGGRPAQMAQEMLDAAILSGEYGGYTLEESSTRLIVRVRSERGREKDKDAEGYEKLRTDRTDSALGKSMQKRLDGLPVGSKILVWKVMEAMRNSEDGEKVRVFKHFEVLNLGNGTAEPKPPAQEPARRDPPPRPEGELPNAGSVIMQRFETLSSKHKALFAKACRENDIAFPQVPDEQIDAALVILSKIEGAS